MARHRQRARDRKQLGREDLPGELEHASGEVEEFDAALIQGADGEPTDISEAERAEQAVQAAPAGGGGGDGSDGDDEPQRRPSGPRPGGNRVMNFLRASWAELQRVQWPDRRQVAQATAVVLGFVAIAGIYLGIADWAAQKIVNYIL